MPDRDPSRRLTLPALAVALACAPAAEPAPDADSAAPGAARGAAPPGDADAPIRTGRATYTVAGGELVVVATYRNASPDTVFVQPCGTRAPLWELHGWQDSAWVSALVPACTMIAAPPLVVAPGAERTDTLRIAGAPGAPAVPRLQAGQVPGTFRLAYAIGARREGEFGIADRLPFARRASNVFRVE